MPLKRCESEGKPGWKWGDSGACYVYTAGNEESEAAARKKALAQAAAMGEFPGTGNRGYHEPVEVRASQITDVDFERRIIELILIPYDQEAVVEYRGEMVAESIAPGAFDGIETRGESITGNRDHDYTRTIGKFISYRTKDSRGLIGDLKVSKTPLGDESLQLASDGVLKGSAGMLVRRADQIVKNGKRRINRAFLDHGALVPNPAYTGAEVLSVRQEQRPLVTDAGPLLTPNLDEILQLLGMQD